MPYAHATPFESYRARLRRRLQHHVFQKARRALLHGLVPGSASVTRLGWISLLQVAEYSSLVTWLVFITWLRLGYNADAFSFARSDVSDGAFNTHLW